jgi:hypothetical protein
MPYLGRQPIIGRYDKLDSIAASFNSAQTVFNLTSSGSAVVPGTARNLIISVGGVIQEPDTAYTVSGSTITFTGAPASTHTFFGVVLGTAVDVGTVTAGQSIQVHTLANTATKTSTYIATIADDLVLANGTFTVTLYTAVGNQGREIEIKNIGTGLVTVAGNGSENIDNANTLTLSTNQSVRTRSDNTQWWKLGTSSNPPFADPNFISGNVTDW